MAKRINLQKVGKKTLELLAEAGGFDSFGASRDAIKAAIPEMVKFSDSHHSNESTGQVLLFADDDVEDNMVDLAKFEEDVKKAGNTDSKLEWLLREKKNLGVFLSGHPLDLYKHDTKKFSQFQIKDIPKKVGSKEVQTVAFLTGISERLTKTNKKMAYVNIEDETGSWEGVMFEKDLPEIYPEINSLVVVKGSISKSYDGTSISFKVESLSPLEDVRREVTRRVEISINGKKDLSHQELASKKAMISQVGKLVSKHPGRNPLTVNLKYGKVIVKINPQQEGIDLSDDFYQSISKLDSNEVGLQYF